MDGDGNDDAPHHVVFTLPAAIADIAHQNKAVVYDLLFRTAAETLLTIAADPKHLGARIGLTAVLHTWGSALTHHPHVHVIVPGGGLAPDGTRWIACRPGFFLPVRVLSTLFRRLMLAALAEAHRAGRLAFFAALAPLKKTKWFVYAKRPFAGPEAMLAYLSRYTHRVAISNRRLVACDDEGVRFRWKDYRADGLARWKTMTLATAEFIRRFLLHTLPDGFHRIRHYGFLANGQRRGAVARALLAAKPGAPDDRALPSDGTGDAAAADAAPPKAYRCPYCGGAMIVVETFRRGAAPASRPAAAAPVIGIDSSRDRRNGRPPAAKAEPAGHPCPATRRHARTSGSCRGIHPIGRPPIAAARPDPWPSCPAGPRTAAGGRATASHAATPRRPIPHRPGPTDQHRCGPRGFFP